MTTISKGAQLTLCLMNLEPSDTKAAVIEWAKGEISSASEVRMEMGKFFFSASAAAIGFLTAAWKAFQPNAQFSGMILYALLALGGSVLVAMYIFWPIIGRWRPDSDIQDAHARLVKRLAGEAVAWGLIWLCGVAMGLWATLTS